MARLTPTSRPPETQFTKVGEIDIAYQVVGQPGGLDIVFIPGWVSHLEVIWELPEYASFLERLAGMGRLLLFDKRGSGLSDRVEGIATLEERAEDVRAVMDAADSAIAAIVAWGDGAAIAGMFAATYPQRVRALVLGSLAMKAAGSDNPEFGPDPAVLQALWEAVEKGWGKASLVPLLAPSRATDERFIAWSRKWERMSATPNAAAATLRWAAEVDFAPVLKAIQAPTMVLHRVGAALFDPESQRAAAGLIPKSRYVELPGRDELPFLGDADAVLDVIQEFLTGVSAHPDFDRSLATMVFTDIVGSTVKATELGDRQWHYLLETHNVEVRKLIARFRGDEVERVGDGFLVTFDGPARAIRFACACVDAVRQLGIQLRIGIHTGELERRANTLAGLALHVGARVGALAAPSQVLVTSVVKTLVLGSGIEFEEVGTHNLKGVPGSWELFAVAR